MVHGIINTSARVGGGGLSGERLNHGFIPEPLSPRDYAHKTHEFCCDSTCRLAAPGPGPGLAAAAAGLIDL